jgi:glycosyltransferase involved in cell wall biosynthesis
MLNKKKIVVVMPAYNAEKTLRKTFKEIPEGFVDEVILTDDFSSDHTLELARNLGLRVIAHPNNQGYGANQKTCYREALHLDADIVIMLHPDYQYTPKLIPAMACMLAYGEFDACLGTRILGEGALMGGMPFYKYLSNRVLTLIQNILLNAKHSEYHTGYRAFRRELLLKIPMEENSNDFAFDNQMIAQVLWFGYRLGEVSCPCRYEPDASSISFRRSIVYGFQVLKTSLSFRLARWGLARPRIFSASGRRITVENRDK